MNAVRPVHAARSDAFAPRALVIPAVLAIVLLVAPLVGLVARAEWGSVLADVSSAAALSALRLSILTALAATATCVLLGVPLAVVMARAPAALAAGMRAVVTVPLVLPPMVGGVALLSVFGRTSAFGRLLADAGIRIPFSTAAVVIAQVFVALPFLVLTVEAALRRGGTDYERTAAQLGAGRWRILLRVTLPIAAPGVIAGIVLCFARAMGEFGATALFAGNAPGTTQTMPLAIYTAFNGAGVSPSTGVALSILLLGTSVLVILLARGWRGGGER